MKTGIDCHKIQDVLHNDCTYKKTHTLCSPNVFVYEWESDFVSVTRAGIIHEYEVKISHSDFMLDAKKYRKHDILKTGSA